MNKKIITFIVIVVTLAAGIYYLGELKISPREYYGEKVSFGASKGDMIDIKGKGEKKEYTIKASDEDFFFLLPSGKSEPLFPQLKSFEFPWDKELFILEEKDFDGSGIFTLRDNGYVHFEVTSPEPVRIRIESGPEEVNGVTFFGFIIWIVLFLITFAIIF